MIARKPSRNSPMSPVASQPAASSTAAVFGRQTVVAPHHAGPADEDLPILGDTKLATRHGRADRAEAKAVGAIDVVAPVALVRP